MRINRTTAPYGGSVSSCGKPILKMWYNIDMKCGRKLFPFSIEDIIYMNRCFENGIPYSLIEKKFNCSNSMVSKVKKLIWGDMRANKVADFCLENKIVHSLDNTIY